MVLNSYDFVIGTAEGNYQAGQIITDSILKRSELSYVMIDSIPNKSDFTHNMNIGTLVFPNSISICNNAIVTVFFKSPLNF